MQLLLCAATELEIKPTIDFLKDKKADNIQVLITGVGLMATAYSLTRSVVKNRPDFMIQAGVGGCLDLTLPLSKVVLVESEIIGDLGVEEQGNFLSIFDLKLTKTNDHPWKDGKLSNDLRSLRETGLTIVDGVSVNEVSTDPDRIYLYKNRYGASVESMEGAAFHYVGLNENIPFLQMRSLSNFVGERDKSKWVMGTAIANLNLELQRILSKFLHR
jgi:futalosine hydrolase